MCLLSLEYYQFRCLQRTHYREWEQQWERNETRMQYQLKADEIGLLQININFI